MDKVIYTGTLNERYILRSASLGTIKAQASRITKRGGPSGTDRLYVTCRRAGELKEMRFERVRPAGSWKAV